MKARVTPDLIQESLGQTPINRILLFITLLSLAATVTNYVVLSCLFAFAIMLLSCYWGRNAVHLSSIQIWAVILFAYFALSTLCYSPSAFLNYDFYRRDGNVFITFLPLIFYGSAYLSCNIEKVIKRYVVWATGINLIGIVLYHLQLMLNNNEYSMFFYAHNAAGGFLCCILSLSVVMFLQKKTPLNTALVLVNAYGVYLTKSRGSIVGLVISWASVFLLKNRHNKKIIFLGCASLTLLLSKSYPMWIETGMKESSFAIDAIDPELFDRVGTVIDRGFFLWPRGVYLWLQSPLLGTGFGSYNDTPYNLVGIKHLFMWNHPHELVYADSHCHHSFLHVLAETGLCGITILILFLAAIHRYLKQIKSDFIRTSLLLLFWIDIWSGFTEHRLFTPSQMLPFTLLLGCVLAVENSRKIQLNHFQLG